MRPGVHERVRLVLVEVLPEVIQDQDRNVEVIQSLVSFLRLDEVLYVRMIDVEDPHVGTTSDASLFDDLRHGVEEPHEAHRTRSDA